MEIQITIAKRGERNQDIAYCSECPFFNDCDSDSDLLNACIKDLPANYYPTNYIIIN